MALLSLIRRWDYRDLSIREIVKRTGLSRNTVRKYLRSDTVGPRFKVPQRSSKLNPLIERVTAWLRREMGRPRKQNRTIEQRYANLLSLGFDGYYGHVAAFARAWRDDYRDLADFDFGSSEGTSLPAPPMRIMDVADNIVLVGGLGTARSTSPRPFGVQAIKHHRKLARLFTTVELVNELEQEKAQGAAGQIAGSLAHSDLVILDQLGYMPLSALGGAPLFHLASKLYQLTSVIINTNFRSANGPACSVMPKRPQHSFIGSLITATSSRPAPQLPVQEQLGSASQNAKLRLDPPVASETES